jgi:hypothetical protein
MNFGAIYALLVMGCLAYCSFEASKNMTPRDQALADRERARMWVEHLPR